ncbi:tetratricopeptide repeat protein [Nonomuraea sp. NPDC049400]|uniref:tetratricopeptide repeat protein n=1 Tax=Nonomuraea sp. NPDC049400 TaxID=3364352 RepID=UPI00378D551F
MATDLAAEAGDSAVIPGAAEAAAGRYGVALRLLEGVPAADPRHRDALLLRLKVLLKMGRYRAAEGVVEQCVTPPSPARLLEVAEICSLEDADLLAARLAGRAVALDPSSWEAYHEQIRYLGYAGRPLEALRLARLAVRRCAGSVELWRDLARFAEQAELRGEALRALDAALAHAPDDVALHRARGDLLLDLLRLPEAAQAFEALPDDARADIAVEYHRQGFHDVALDFVDRALADDPEDVRLRLTRIDYLRDAARFDEAEREWQLLREHHAGAPQVVGRLIEQGLLDDADRVAGTPDLLVRLAHSYGERERDLDALAAAERASAIAPDDDLVRRSVATCLLKLHRDGEAHALIDGWAPEDVASLYESVDRTEDAITHWRAAVERAPWDRIHAERLVDALTDAGRHREAARELRQAIGRRPEDPDGYLLKQSILEEKGRRRRALGAARRAAALAPDDLRVQSAYVGQLLRLRRFRRAEQTARAVASRTPDGADLLCQVADELISLVRYEDALRIAREAARIDPTGRRPMEVSAHALYELGRIAEADRIANHLTALAGGGPRGLLDVAGWLSRIEEDTRAVAYAERALAEVPGNAEATAAVAAYLYYSGQKAEGMRVARQGLAGHPGDVDLWLWLIRNADARDAPTLAAEALAAFPENQHGDLLIRLASSLEYWVRAPEAALDYYERARNTEPDAFLGVSRMLQELDRPFAVLELFNVASHPQAAQGLADYFRHLGLPALAAGVLDGRALPRRAWWRSGGPIRPLRRLLHSTEWTIISRAMQRWHGPLRILDSIDGVAAGDLADARKEAEHYFLRHVRVDTWWWWVLFHLRTVAGMAGAWVMWPVIATFAPTASTAATVAGLITACTLVGTLFRKPFGYLTGASICGSFAIGGAALLRMSPTTGAGVAGVALLGLAAAIAIRGSYVRLGSLVSILLISRIRGLHGRGATLDALCDALDEEERRNLGRRIEQVAQRMERYLPRWFKGAGAGPDAQLDGTLRGAARAVRELRKQALGPGRERVREELRDVVRAVASGDLATLRQCPEPPVPAEQRGWKERLLLISRTVAVMGLPILAVTALKPVIGLEGDVYRSALLISIAWAVFCLLLAIDPALRDKIDTARELLSSVGITSNAESSSEARAKPGHEDPGKEPGPAKP